jgi:4a-hydroxytetrahydrobiopterin dehydratase
MSDDLAHKRCGPCEGSTDALSAIAIKALLKQVPGWEQNTEGTEIHHAFTFKDFASAMEFANKIAAVADEENHHPDLIVSWGLVKVSLTTHAINGLSKNDFILAAKINSLTNNVIVI